MYTLQVTFLDFLNSRLLQEKRNFLMNKHRLSLLFYIYSWTMWKVRNHANSTTHQVNSILKALSCKSHNMHDGIIICICINTTSYILVLWCALNWMLSFPAKQLSLSDNIKALQQYLVGVGVPNSQSSLKCFTTNEAVITLQYVHSSLFQHYRLFQYLFIETQEEEIICDKVHIFL